jgi:hypothetical protein
MLASEWRDNLYLIDSTIVKAHRAASVKKGKKSQAIGPKLPRDWGRAQR